MANNGFTGTIRPVFSESQTQICVVYQIRNAWKYRKAFPADMKHISKQAAKPALNDGASKYSYVIKS